MFKFEAFEVGAEDVYNVFTKKVYSCSKLSRMTMYKNVNTKVILNFGAIDSLISNLIVDCITILIMY